MRWQPTDRQWWLVAVVALVVVCAWPPRDDRSLAVTFVNWAVDPMDELPILPDQLALGRGDDPDAVSARDMQVQQYDALYLKGGWTRTRLEWKVARDPFNPATERQLLTGLAIFTALLLWRLNGSKQDR